MAQQALEKANAQWQACPTPWEERPQLPQLRQQCQTPVSYTHLDVYKRQVYIPPTNGPFFKVENPIFESKRARKIWLPILLILGAVTVGGMFIGHFFF